MRYPDKNCYDSLGVSRNATAWEIKRAYRAQMKYFHPDVYPGSPEIADAKSKELNAAYAILSDPVQRKWYNAWLLESEQRLARERARQEQEAREAERKRAAEAAQREAERKRAAEEAQREAERTQAAERAQREAEEAFYNAWWHEFAGYEATREDKEAAARDAAEFEKCKAKWNRRYSWWSKVQLVFAYMFLSLLPIVVILYYLTPLPVDILIAILPPYCGIMLVGIYVSSFVVKKLENSIFSQS